MASEHIKELTECTVCFEIFTEPMRLKCGHVFCKQCVDNTLANQVMATSHQSELRCPLCRKTSAISELAVDNRTYAILEILKEIEFKPKNSRRQCTKVVCEWCDEHAIESRCYECKQWLCHSCQTVHNKNADNSLHNLSHWEMIFKPVKTEIEELLVGLKDRINECASTRNLYTFGIAFAAEAEEFALNRSAEIMEEHINTIKRAHETLDQNIRASFRKRKRPLEEKENEMRNAEADLRKFDDDLLRNMKCDPVKVTVEGPAIIESLKTIVYSKPDYEVKMALPMFTLTRNKNALQYNPLLIKLQSDTKQYLYLDAINVQNYVNAATSLPQLVTLLAQKSCISHAEIFKIEVKINGMFIVLNSRTFQNAKNTNNHTYRIIAVKSVPVVVEDAK